jgi:hypothetical protein
MILRFAPPGFPSVGHLSGSIRDIHRIILYLAPDRQPARGALFRRSPHDPVAITGRAGAQRKVVPPVQRLAVRPKVRRKLLQKRASSWNASRCASKMIVARPSSGRAAW